MSPYVGKICLRKHWWLKVCYCCFVVDFGSMPMGGSTDKHRLTVSVNPELWAACSQVSAQNGMSWSRVAEAALEIYVRYHAPRVNGRVWYGNEGLNHMSLRDAINYFKDGGDISSDFDGRLVPRLTLFDDAACDYPIPPEDLSESELLSHYYRSY